MCIRLFGILAVMALLGCPSRSVSPMPAPSPAPAADAEPAWLSSGSGFFGTPTPVARGVGVANNIRSKPLALQTATSNARAALAKEVEQSLTALFKRYDMPSDEESAADEQVRRQFSAALAPLWQQLQPAATWESRDGAKVAVVFEIPITTLVRAVRDSAPLNDPRYEAKVNALQKDLRRRVETP